MKRRMRLGSLALAGAAAWVAATATLAQAQARQPWPVMGRVLQEIAEFDNPEGSVFSADGKSLYVSNAAIWDCDGFAWTEGGGYISKLSVGANGQVSMVNKQLAAGITAPLGMAVNRYGTRMFPAGSIFIGVGSAPMGTKDCQPISDRGRLKTGVLVIDELGKKLGMIDMSIGSVFHRIAGGPVLLTNALDFDSRGNLYVVDSGIGAGSFSPPITGAPGIWMIPYESIDDVASGRLPSRSVKFIPMPGGPDGVEVSPLDDSIHVNTVGAVVGMPDPDNGGMWRLTMADFEAGRLPKPYASGLGALDGLDFTDKGTRIDTEIMRSGPRNNIVISPIGLAHGQTPYGFGPHYLPLDKEIDITGPADVDLLTLGDGSILLSVPELSVGSRGAKDHVTIIRLPAYFDNPPQGEELKKMEGMMR
jgi:hypothetical protein